MDNCLSYSGCRIGGQEEGRAIPTAVSSSAAGVKEGTESFGDCIQDSTKKKTAEAREEFRKAEDQAVSTKALATAAQLTVEASTVIFEAATAHSKALIAAAKKVDEVNTQVEVDNDEQSNSSDSEVSDEDAVNRVELPIQTQ